ncbi:hypothetical protein GCM10023317_44940 [Actinopolymorpha pittospori]
MTNTCLVGEEAAKATPRGRSGPETRAESSMSTGFQPIKQQPTYDTPRRPPGRSSRTGASAQDLATIGSRGLTECKVIRPLGGAVGGLDRDPPRFKHAG